MDLATAFIDFVLHLDTNLNLFIKMFGPWTYAILFSIIFSEIGFVVTPFLPGDSLILIAGTFARTGSLELTWLFATFSLAAVLGDTVNYSIGHYVGPKVFRENSSRFFKREYLDRSHEFYERHGGKTIVLARFIPVIRSFAPFVAGIGRMTYRRFIIYNIAGGVGWVSLFSVCGYFFGGVQVVRDNLSLVIIAVVLLSVVPGIASFLLRPRRNSARRNTPAAAARGPNLRARASARGKPKS